MVIVLRVNERIATSHDYERRRAEKIRAIQNASSLNAERRQEMLAEVGVSTMEDIFEELLMLSRADQLRLEVTSAEVDRSIESTRQSLGIDTEEQFQAALRSSSLTVEQLRRNMEKNLLIQKLMGAEIQPRISLEEEDLRRYYQAHLEDFQTPERVHLREVVLLESSSLPREDLMTLATEIRDQLLGGQSLEEVVDPYVQQGVSSKAVELGWVQLGDLDRDLEQAVWGLEAGGVSEPIVGRGGVHVLQVSEREEARLRSFAEVSAEIDSLERDRLFADEMQKYLEELESRAYIVANPPPEAAGFQTVLQSPGLRDDDLATALTAPLISQPLEPEADQSPSTPQAPEADETKPPVSQPDEPPLG